MTKQDFINGASGYGSHRPLLWEALEATKDSQLPVIELGAGDGSTPYLFEYCRLNGLEFYSYDYNYEYAKKFQDFGTLRSDWHPASRIWEIKYSVALVDESPGEHRKESIKILKAEILVIHDSESVGWNASDYKVRPLFSKFKYVKDDVPKEKGAPWTSAVSNTIDVTKWP